jgi:hypothetical protein
VKETIAAPRTEQPALQFHPVLPQLLLLALTALLVLSAWRAYARTTRGLSMSQRVLLVGVRVCAIAAVLFCLARPVLVQRRELREKSVGFIALDSSASMDLRDTAGGRTRWETARAILAAHQRDVEQLSESWDLERCLFDSTAQKVARLPGESGPRAAPSPVPPPAAGRGQGEGGPHGLTTDLAGLLEKLAADAGGVSASGAIIISDGRHNAPKDVAPVAAALERAGVPLYCIGLGQEATPADYRDIRIRELSVPEKAFIGSRMMLRVEIESTLPSPVAVPLTIEVAGKKVYHANTILAQGTNVPAPVVEIPYRPEALGAHRVVATLGTVPGEADVNNNTRSAFFRVYRSKLGVWYVEGAIRKEFGAIRTALETAPNVELRALNAFMARTSNPEDLLPRTPEEWAQTRLVIIGDLAVSRFDAAALQRVARFVEDGGAVLMVGGTSNLGAGAWHRSYLAAALPVEVSLSDGLHNEPLPIRVGMGEAAHPILAIGETPEQSEALWKQLPPLPGVTRVTAVRPAARVLLRAGNDELLVVQEYGKGRSAVITADTTWQWVLKANQGEVHKRFWRNLVTWLTRSDYRDTDKAVFADSERLQHQAGEEASFRVLVHETEKTGPAFKSAQIVLTLTRVQNGLEAVVFKEEAGVGVGEYSRRYALGVPGSYRFRASAIAPDGQVLDSDSVDVQVTAPGVEHDNPKANLALLRRIASLSGGMYYDPEHAGDAFQALLRRQADYSKSITDVTDLWNRPWVVAVFVTLLSLEWMLRKRWGLI